MTAHPNRSSKSKMTKSPPTPAQVREARENAMVPGKAERGATQTEAAAIVYSTLRTWQNWENERDPKEQRPMHPAIFELFLIKTGQVQR